MIRNWRIIGLGSPQGDDALGWSVVETLQQERLPDTIELMVLDRPGSTLLHYLQGVDRVLLIDAFDGGYPPGTIMQLSSDELDQWDKGNLLHSPVSLHGLGVAETLSLADACQISLSPIALILVQLSTLEPMKSLVSEVELAVTKLKAHILQMILSEIER